MSAMIVVATLFVGQAATGAGKSRSSVIQLQQLPRHPTLHIPLIHSGQIEEQFGILMESQYGAGWSRRMSERVVNDHRRVFIVQRTIGLNMAPIGTASRG